LGREHVFRAMFAEMKGWLLENGVRSVLVACPNCHKVFREYGSELKVKTVCEALAENGPPRSEKQNGTFVVHDPCAVRFEKSIHGAVRDLIENLGVTTENIQH
jgi:Fe-S oxidoreductase